jgi:hypothetical protein
MLIRCMAAARTFKRRVEAQVCMNACMHVCMYVRMPSSIHQKPQPTDAGLVVRWNV